MSKKPVEHNYELRMKIMQLLSEEVAYYYRYFENGIGATREEIKREMDWLREHNFAIHAKGLFSEDGEVAGSGFMKKERIHMTYEEYLEHLESQFKSDKG